MTETTTTATVLDLTTMPVYELANLIRRDWKKTSKNGVNFAAVPYLDAMGSMNSVNDKYGCDDGKSIIIYFLGNATSWRGDVAKQVKTELKRRIK